MEEYQDCLQRARRLALASEATLSGSDSAMSAVTLDDLLIYTRWFICMLHSVKRINGFIRVGFPFFLEFEIAATHQPPGNVRPKHILVFRDPYYRRKKERKIELPVV